MHKRKKNFHSLSACWSLDLIEYKHHFIALHQKRNWFLAHFHFRIENSNKTLNRRCTLLDGFHHHHRKYLTSISATDRILSVACTIAAHNATVQHRLAVNARQYLRCCLVRRWFNWWLTKDRHNTKYLPIQESTSIWPSRALLKWSALSFFITIIRVSSGEL